MGTTLHIPIGDSISTLRISSRTAAIRCSLRTESKPEAKLRHAAVIAYLEKVWKRLRDKPRALTHKQTVALAGEIYRRFTAALEDDPGSASLWRGVREQNQLARAGRFGTAALMIGEQERKAAALEQRFGAFADLVLTDKALSIDAESRTRLLEQVAKAMDEAAERLLRNAEGDFRPDENALRFPRWEGAGAVAAQQGHVSLSGLLEGWKREASAAGKAARSTVEAYGAAVRRFIAFLGHDDASRVRPVDVVAFKDARLAEINPRTGKPISAKTVNDGDLSGLKTVFNWAVRNRKIESNPAAGVTVAFAAPVRKRSKAFTDAEATSILRHALHYRAKPQENPKTATAKKWVPWLCAYSGARLGEMVQLRKQDVWKDGGFYFIRVTPEAGTVKGRKFRDVPLHPHLVELGFLDFVSDAKDGHLFLMTSKKEDWRGPWRAVKNRVREFVREVVKDPEVQPNHGWRHRFITECRRHGVDQEIRRMITGHRGEGVDEEVYGDPAGLHREIAKLPRYDVAGLSSGAGPRVSEPRSRSAS